MKFYAFLILQGLVMPSFMDFDYYFAIDILGIKASLISLQFVWSSIFMIIVPLTYVIKFRDTEFRTIFTLVQSLWLTSYFGKLSLAEGWAQAIGLPIFPVYFLSGAFLNSFERVLVILPSKILLAKMTPRGIESSVMALSDSIVMMNQFMVRGLIGLAIN